MFRDHQGPEIVSFDDLHKFWKKKLHPIQSRLFWFMFQSNVTTDKKPNERITLTQNHKKRIGEG